jgi:GT2 family glycosyltransferase
MPQNEFSIALLFYNKPALTKKCLDNLLENIERTNYKFDIVLIDNGSGEDARKELEKKVVDEISVNANHSLDMISINPNKGFSVGMNSGLKKHFQKSDAPLLCMSNDVELDIDFFDNLKKMIDTASITNAVFCPHVFYQMDKSKPSYTHGIVEIINDLGLSHHYDEKKTIITFPEYYPAAATVWTKEVYEKIGGFNEKFYCYWEDVELSYRCAKYGVELVSSSGLKIFHLGRGTTSGKKQYYDHFLTGKELVRGILNVK